VIAGLLLRIQPLGAFFAGFFRSLGFRRVLALGVFGGLLHLPRLDEFLLVLVIAPRGGAIAFAFVGLVVGLVGRRVGAAGAGALSFPLM